MRIVIEREIRVAARRPLTHWSRVGTAGLLVLFLLSFVFPGFSAGDGRGVFAAAVLIGTFGCAFDAVRRAAGSIIEEKNQGTLVLLLLTRLTGTELVYGKFVAAVIPALQTALSVVPVIAISLALGGITIGEVIRAAFGLIYVAIISTTIAIRVSAGAKDSVTAVGSSFFFLGVIALVGLPLFFLGFLACVSPLSPVLGIFDDAPQSTFPFWISLFLYTNVAWRVLREAGRSLPRFAREEQGRIDPEVLVAQHWVQHRKPGAAPPRTDDPFIAPAWFEGDPIEWLTRRELRANTNPWEAIIFVSIMGVLVYFASDSAGILMGIMCLAALALALSVASARTLAVARQSNALELIITTPLGEEGLIDGHYRALRRLFIGPILIVLVAFFAIAVDKSRHSLFPFYLLAGYVALLLATPWIGMWMGLRSRTPTRAIIAALFYVIILPRVGFCVGIDAPYFLVLGAFAHHQVRNSLRKLIATP
jgi:hypothetical protein